MSEVLCKKMEIWIEGREQTRESQYIVREGKYIIKASGMSYLDVEREPTLPYLLCSAPITTLSTSPSKAKS